MRVELIEDMERFRALRQEWNELLEHSAADCVFLTWEWLYTWWKHFGRGREISLFAVRDADELIGLAPLVLSPLRLARFRVFRALEFMGTGNVGSDYLDVISRRGRERDVVEALADHLERRRTTLRLGQVDGDSSLTPAIAARLARRYWTMAVMPADVCPFIRLTGLSWESYLATLSHDHRYNVRRGLRILESRFDVRYERAVTDAERRAGLAEVVRLNHWRWKGHGGSTAFCSPALVAFHEEFSRLALERGWLRLFVLELGGRPVAAFYGIRDRRRFYYYQSGFDLGYAKLGVGAVALALSIKSAIDEGAEEYDFLHGAEPYKFRWARDIRELHRLELYPPDLRGWLCRRAVESARGARRLARRALPRMVVQAMGRGR